MFAKNFLQSVALYCLVYSKIQTIMVNRSMILESMFRGENFDACII